MAFVRLNAMAVGSIVKIKVDDVLTDFIIVHQGLPGSSYDESCNGTWVLMKDTCTKTSYFSSYQNSYSTSSSHTYMNGTFLNKIDEGIRGHIKQVKIPYWNGRGDKGSLAKGSSGLSCKVFSLSGYEVGLTTSNHQYLSYEGSRLEYFIAGTDTDAKEKRIAYYAGSANGYWLRSVNTGSPDNAFYIGTSGGFSNGAYNWAFGIRPAFVLDADLWVFDDGTVGTNTAPVISTDTTDLGEKNAPFTFGYTVMDVDGDTMTVTEKLDGKTTKTRTGVASGTALTFGQSGIADIFQRVLNGSHTVQIIADDSKESTAVSVTFTKNVTAATVTLITPLAVEGDITIAALQISGSIPEDAVFKVEVTNNALDDSPVWQDVTEEVQKGVNIVFANKTAAKGAAFNFRVSVSRGASGTGGYIEAVSGAFQ